MDSPEISDEALNLGYTMHLVLRKGSETEWSGFLWSLIAATPDDSWPNFAAHVFKIKEADGCDLPTAIRKAAKRGPEGQYTRWNGIIYDAFKLCDDETINDIAKGIEYWG